MKNCLHCQTSNDDESLTCSACGEGSFDASAEPDAAKPEADASAEPDAAKPRKRGRQ